MEFASDTDTEVAVHLVSRQYDHGDTAGDFAASVLAVLRRLEGHFTLVFANADEPGMIVAARRSTPLVVGVGDGEMFVGSDVAAFIEHTRDAIELGQDQAVVITADGYRITDFDGDPDDVECSGPFISTGTCRPPKRVATSTSCSRRSPSSPPRSRTRCSATSSTAASCSTSSGFPTRNCARSTRCSWWPAAPPITPGCWPSTPSSTGRGCPSRSSSPANSVTATRFWISHTLVVAISQSGETADTLEAVRHAKEQKAKVLAICNTNGSQIPRECDAVLYTRAGPEIGVASTKTFLAQIAANYLVGLALAQARGTKYPDEVEREYRDLEAMPDLVARVLETVEPVSALAHRFAQSQTVLFLGRHVGYPVALEGALKLKELAYMHAEGFAAGELKHGPIALIEDGLPVIVVMPSPKNAPTLHAKLLSNIREIQARGAVTIVIAEEGDDTVRPYADHLIEIPAVSTLFQPLLSTIPLQVFAAGVAQARGYDVDKPRNLAKSVTVE